MATGEEPSASEFINAARFNRSFELPRYSSDDQTSSLKVTYADYGYHSEPPSTSDKVLLWFPPLMASRLEGITRDSIARRYRIRVIAIDRPGLGGTQSVAGESRLRVCRLIVLELLKHLAIQHCFLAAHSGGCVYALDFLLHHPEVLDPRQPYLALGAPWILPVHTSSTAMAILQRLPASVISHTHRVTQLLSSVGAPAIANSLAAMSKSAPADLEADDNDYIAEVNFARKTWPAIYSRMNAEGSGGVSAEALLLLQKVGDIGGWDEWKDYDTLIPHLIQKLQDLSSKLRVDVFYAESDWMIGDAGTKGPVWFDECWRSVSASEDVVEYRSAVVHRANHDTIWQLEHPAMRQLLTSIAAFQ